jgi:hypothetical protein
MDEKCEELIETLMRIRKNEMLLFDLQDFRIVDGHEYGFTNSNAVLSPRAAREAISTQKEIIKETIKELKRKARDLLPYARTELSKEDVE